MGNGVGDGVSDGVLDPGGPVAPGAVRRAFGAGGRSGNVARIVDGADPASVALVDGEFELTFGELADLVAATRGGLVALGVRPGDRVAIAIPGSMPFVVAHLAALGVGAVSVPLDPREPGPALSRALAAAGAGLLLAGDAPGVEGLDRDRLDLGRVVRLGGPAWDRLTRGDPVPIVDRPADAAAVVLLTGGTAGMPRPAMLTHANLAHNLDQVASVPGRRPGPSDSVLVALPLSHVFGLNAVLHLSLVGGASAVLLDPFVPRRALELVARHRITHVAGVPAMWDALLSEPGAPDGALASVRVASSGGASLPPRTAAGVEARFGVHVDEGYGLTEASPVVTTASGVGAPRGSVGPPLPGVEVRIVDADGSTALQHDPGEIWVRGPNVFAGYLGDPEATAAVLTADGWLRTGDLGVVDEAGNLFVVDRAKDLVIVSGFNVVPAEVEEVLAGHPGVRAVSVAGVAHERTGETVEAWVVPAEDDLDVGELLDRCRRDLARYKCPTAVHLVDALPAGPTGKVLRRSLG
jgi:long-chain acyl-CoA synthetase